MQTALPPSNRSPVPSARRRGSSTAASPMAPSPPGEQHPKSTNTLAAALPADVTTHVVSFLTTEALCALYVCGKEGCPDRAWRARTPAHSLFKLKQPQRFTTFRKRWAEWTGAKRTGVVVAPGRFRFRGSVEDRRGVCRSRGGVWSSRRSLCAWARCSIRAPRSARVWKVEATAISAPTPPTANAAGL